MGNFNSINNHFDDKLLLAVWMITYNQENYIEKAIESIINQKCNFNFKLFIGEDFSTDKTRELCLFYKNKYPDKIELVLQKENIGGPQNGNCIYNLCCKSQAKYIALCEGDDYWIDPYKLQKQVDFLEKNEDYVMCFTRYKRYFQDEDRFQLNGHNLSKKYILKDFMYANQTATATVVYRNIKIDYDLLKLAPFGDWVLFNLLLKKGDAYYLNDITAVYRRHSINSEFYNPLPYKKKLYKMNVIFFKIHGVKYLYIFFKNYIKLFFLNRLY